MNDLSEKEQLELMRTWWAENGRYVIGGVVLGIAILYSWNTWQRGIADAELAASAMYENLMNGVGDDDADAAEAASAELFALPGDSVYTSLGRLAMARLYMDKGRDQDAADVLQALVEEDPDSEVGIVGRLRLARVLLYQDKADEVIALLKDRRDNAYSPRYDEVLGDAYTAVESYDEALAAYTAAQNDGRSPAVVDNELIQLKINDLPGQDQIDAMNPIETPTGEDDSSAATDESAMSELPEALAEETETGASDPESEAQ